MDFIWMIALWMFSWLKGRNKRQSIRFKQALGSMGLSHLLAFRFRWTPKTQSLNEKGKLLSKLDMPRDSLYIFYYLKNTEFL